MRQRDRFGRLLGTLLIIVPPARVAVTLAMMGEGDLGHFRRTTGVSRAERRPAAILTADLEGSSALARKLSTSSYLALVRRLVSAVDRCVVDAGGIVGRHVGDPVTAFFLFDHLGSESAAARVCTSAACDLVPALERAAERSGLQPEEVIIRAGLHWGATLYVGNIATSGRTEVTALGDEVNETARIETCAASGRLLATKALVERLGRNAADSLGIEPSTVVHVALADLPTATDRARRDAPNLSVCDITGLDEPR